MADIQISEHTFLRGLPEGWANAQEAQKVVLWDCGPPKPEMPKRPKPPVGKDGEPEYDLAMIEFREALVDYEAGLRVYKERIAEHTAFHVRNGGPVEFVQWSCDAQDTLRHDGAAVDDGRQAERRYYISSRTRGHAKLRNGGLPNGVKPGHGQAEQDERARQGGLDFETLRRADPVFGNQEMRS